MSALELKIPPLALLAIAALLAVAMESLTPQLTIQIPFWYMNRFQIVPEERFLQQKFGEEYTQFLREVCRWV